MRIAGRGLAKSAGQLRFTIGVVVILLIAHPVPFAGARKNHRSRQQRHRQQRRHHQSEVHHSSQLLVDGAMVGSPGNAK
jgi:hypothetical protein